MNPRNWLSPQRGLGVLALLVVVPTLVTIGGLPGGVFAAAVVIAWLTAPPVFAFVFAQAGLAAVTSPPYPPIVLVGELGVLALAISDPRLPLQARTYGIAVGGVAVLAGAVWLTHTTALWGAVLVSLAGTGMALYGVHRYELLTTGQLSG